MANIFFFSFFLALGFELRAVAWSYILKLLKNVYSEAASQQVAQSLKLGLNLQFSCLSVPEGCDVHLSHSNLLSAEAALVLITKGTAFKAHWALIDPAPGSCLAQPSILKHLFCCLGPNRTTEAGA